MALKFIVKLYKKGLLKRGRWGSWGSCEEKTPSAWPFLALSSSVSALSDPGRFPGVIVPRIDLSVQPPYHTQIISDRDLQLDMRTGPLCRSDSVDR